MKCTLKLHNCERCTLRERGGNEKENSRWMNEEREEKKRGKSVLISLASIKLETVSGFMSLPSRECAQETQCLTNWLTGYMYNPYWEWVTRLRRHIKNIVMPRLSGHTGGGWTPSPSRRGSHSVSPGCWMTCSWLDDCLSFLLFFLFRYLERTRKKEKKKERR